MPHQRASGDLAAEQDFHLRPDRAGMNRAAVIDGAVKRSRRKTIVRWCSPQETVGAWIDKR